MVPKHSWRMQCLRSTVVSVGIQVASPKASAHCWTRAPGGKPGGGGKSWPAGVALKGLNPPGMGWRKKEASWLTSMFTPDFKGFRKNKTLKGTKLKIKKSRKTKRRGFYFRSTLQNNYQMPQGHQGRLKVSGKQGPCPACQGQAPEPW